MVYKIKKTNEDYVLNIASTFISVFVMIVSIYPLYYCLIHSLNDGADSLKGAMYLIPRKLTLDNYAMVFKSKDIFSAFVVTVLRTAIGTSTSVLFTAMVAYGLSKDYIVFRKVYMIFGLISLYFAGGVIPTYLLYQKIGLIGKFAVYIIPPLMNFFNVLLFIAFFRELPSAMEEVAKIDGAGHFTIFIRIVMPLSLPILATITLFVGVWHWNDWFFPAFYITDEKLITLPAILMRVMSLAKAYQKIQKEVQSYQMRSAVTMESVRYATLLIAVAPILALYPFLQKYLVKGMLIGAIKA